MTYSSYCTIYTGAIIQIATYYKFSSLLDFGSFSGEKQSLAENGALKLLGIPSDPECHFKEDDVNATLEVEENVINDAELLVLVKEEIKEESHTIVLSYNGSKEENDTKVLSPNGSGNPTVQEENHRKVLSPNGSGNPFIQEEIGDHKVEVVEKTLNSGKVVVTCYVDWRFIFNLRYTKDCYMYFTCNSRDCKARITVQKDFSEMEGHSKYQPLRLTGGPHNHGEQRERVLLDYSRSTLKREHTKGWNHKSNRDIYNDFINSFSACLDEETKSLFFVTFPPYKVMESTMLKWKKSSRKRLHT